MVVVFIYQMANFTLIIVGLTTMRVIIMVVGFIWNKLLVYQHCILTVAMSFLTLPIKKAEGYIEMVDMSSQIVVSGISNLVIMMNFFRSIQMVRCGSMKQHDMSKSIITMHLEI